ncbi:MAG TPA: hypothetical protein DIT32_00320 [Peptococcaceae bacterium]|nr:hypothetical protein [Peptococcaceae bacterium]
MKGKISSIIFAVLAACFLFVSGPVFATEKADTPAVTPEKQTEATEAVQPQVDEEAEKKAAEQRKKIMEEAHAAIAESKKALKALDDGKTEEALKALEQAIGKMELIVARDPELALARVDVNVKVYDLFANLDTLKKAVKQAKEYLDDGEVQLARPLIAGLASEMVIESINIPLATYPDAIKSVVPLIDKGEIDEAKAAIQTALNTLVVVKEHVIPLPVVRAKELLKEAETLAEKKDRTDEESKELAALLDDAENQLKMAEVLGYGKKKAFKPMYEQLDTIRDKTKDDKSGKGFFNKIKDQISNMFN